MAKALDSLQWVEELLPKDHLRKHMFGGFGYYLETKIVLAIFESTGDRTYKNKTYDFDLWNGCLFPCERENHPSILKKFPMLSSHPVLSKWLYLPVQTENFETVMEEILKEIRRRSPLFGVIPRGKKTKKPRENLNALKKTDTRKPMMFREEPVETKLANAQKISDLKNLGPVSETAFKKAGIKSAQQFIKLGWQKTMVKLVKSNPKNRHSLYAYALIGALSNTDWNRIPENEKEAAKKFVASLKKSSRR
jgi:hypothetical protein